MVLLSLVFASALLFCLPLQAQEIPRPREGVINSSGSGQLKVVTYEVMNAQATVVMLPGAEGSTRDANLSINTLSNLCRYKWDIFLRAF